MDLTLLNEKQKEAVTHIKGPLLILAGPGSGKTRVLTNKIAYLLENKYALPMQVLAITFTNKAAKEMKERLYKLIGNDTADIQLSTFHSFGLRIIKENYIEFGLNKAFSIIDENDSISLIKKILKDFNMDEKIYNPKYIKNKISSSKNNLVDVIDYGKYAKGNIEENIYKIYKKYQEVLLSNSSVDFDDLLFLPVKLFRSNKKILDQYVELFRYIYIDEYQDTNEAQYIMTKMIASKYQNITVVGDESQNVYSWRGANYKNILNFERDYKNVKTVLLEQNYRSTKTILNAANDVIKNNKERKDKKLWTENEDGRKIKYIRVKDEKEECYTVIKEIKRLNINIDYKNMVVLYRTNAQSQSIEKAFLESNIPYRIVGSYTYYNRKEIKDLISYLKLINNIKDNVCFMRSVNTPRRGIGKKTIEELEEKTINKNISLFEAIESGKELDFKKMILDLIEIKDKISLTEFVELVLDKSRLIEEYKKENSIEALSKIENLREFKSITKEFEEKTGNISLEDFLSEISLLTDLSETKEDVNGVSLMTLHSAKGLEFDVVFILGLEEGVFPHINSFDEVEGLEEERRLFYVGITRAKDYLYLLNAQSRLLYGNKNMNMPSRFIKEINKEYLELEETLPEEKESFVDSFYEEDVYYEVGEHVYHDTFKDGIVVSVENKLVNIAFGKKYGIKKLMKNHKSLRKIW
ncbi:MAG: 3'-5' exonuclease [Bacilli bacterium]|nr:3'-5' exonuclease [Bacilli bacterium]